MYALNRQIFSSVYLCRNGKSDIQDASQQCMCRNFHILHIFGCSSLRLVVAMLLTGQINCSSLSSAVSSRFLKCLLTCCPVSILICLRLNLQLFIISPCHHIMQQLYPFPTTSSLALPNIFPSVMWSKLSCLRTAQAIWFLHQNVFNMLLASLAHTNISLFVTFSVQLIFSILHHVHISNASNTFLLTLVNVQVSAAYNAAFKTVLFIIRFVCSQFNFRSTDVYELQ